MTRLAIRTLFACAALSALALALLAIPDGSGLPMWDREPRALLVALGCFVGAAVVAVALAIKLHRITDLLAALWPDVPHQWRIAEAEARGEAPN